MASTRVVRDADTQVRDLIYRSADGRLDLCHLKLLSLRSQLFFKIFFVCLSLEKLHFRPDLLIP